MESEEKIMMVSPIVSKVEAVELLEDQSSWWEDRSTLVAFPSLQLVAQVDGQRTAMVEAEE